MSVTGADKAKPLPKDLKSLTALAEKGDARAQLEVGQTYYFGTGVEQDDEEAVKWYRKAAIQGHRVAQYNLGEMYATGRIALQKTGGSRLLNSTGVEEGNPHPKMEA